MATVVPVDNGCQVKKSVLHWNVCNCQSTMPDWDGL